MSSIYKFRVLLEAEKTIFKDIEIKSDSTFYSFHMAIMDAYGFDGDQMASFYMSNDSWDKGEEISLVDGEGLIPVKTMQETKVNQMICLLSQHMLYTYDFLNMWNFYIELIEIRVKDDTNRIYPCVIHEQGQTPDFSERDKLLSDEQIMLEIYNSMLKEELDGSLTNDENFDEFNEEDYQ